MQQSVFLVELFFFMLKKLNLEADVLYLTTSLFIISVRLMAVKFKWHLPPLSYK